MALVSNVMRDGVNAQTYRKLAMLLNNRMDL